MKILYVTHHRRSKIFARPGAWAREMARRGHEVTVLCIGETARWGVRTFNEGGARIVETPDLLWGRLRSGWDPWSTGRRMIWMRGRAFDLVHCFETRPATIYPVLQYLRRSPASLVMDWNDWWGRGGVITLHRPVWYQRMFGGMETWFEEHFRFRADATTVTSRALAQRAVGLGVRPDSITQIPNGVDVASFEGHDRAVARERLGLPGDDVLLGYIGRDVNFDLPLIVEATMRVRAAHPHVRLLLAGNRPPGYDALVARLGARDAILHLGLRPYSDIPVILAATDICLMPFTRCPTNIGAWPAKLGDYLAAGRPIVANPVGEVEILLRAEGAGLLAEESPEAFAEAIARLIQDETLRRNLGNRARETARHCLSWCCIGDQIEAVYRRVTEEWGRPEKRGEG